jgi:hypothetical protein
MPHQNRLDPTTLQANSGRSKSGAFRKSCKIFAAQFSTANCHRGQENSFEGGGSPGACSKLPLWFGKKKEEVRGKREEERGNKEKGRKNDF